MKGHVGHELNEAADDRARAVATAYQRGTAIPEGPGFGIAPAPRPAQPVPATPVDEAPRVAPPSLFDLADAASGAPASRSVTVELPEDEWARLERRARRAGVSPEQLLRELAARA